MTLSRAAVVVRRRWWVVLLGIALTAGAGVYVQRAPGVYYQQVNVVFLWPQPPQNQENSFQYGSSSLIRTAGVVARAVGGRAEASTVSETATLAGKGVRHGWSVRLPNSGGQWAFDFEQPVLSVEAVGTTPEEAAATTAGVVGRINGELAALQRSERVQASLMIRTRLSPPTPVLQYAGGNRPRALLMSQLVGLILTLTAARLVDGRLRRRRRSAPAADRELVPA